MNLTTDQVQQIWLDNGMNALKEQELIYLTDVVNTRGTAMMDDMNAEQWVNAIAKKIQEEATEDQAEEASYMLLIQYKGQKEVIVMHTNTDGRWRQCIAKEGNQHLLTEMGDRLIDENIIDAYQLVKTAGKPVLTL
jgi:hypothetical protein